MKSTFRTLTKDEFPFVHSLMKLSFPPAEFRIYEEALALLDYPNYNILAAEEDGVLQAFIAEWVLKDIHFVEHFAVNPEARGQGLGTRIMRDYLAQTHPVVIEVEAEDTLIAKRRIAFYERLGFVQSGIEYLQPLLQTADSTVLLRLMHYPPALSAKALYNIKREIFDTVYNISHK